jgi:hypothetical protein
MKLADALRKYKKVCNLAGWPDCYYQLMPHSNVIFNQKGEPVILVLELLTDYIDGWIEFTEAENENKKD